MRKCHLLNCNNVNLGCWFKNKRRSLELFRVFDQEKEIKKKELQLIWHIPIKRPRGWGSLARVKDYHTSNGTLTWAWFTDTLQIKAMDALDMYIVHIYIYTYTCTILEQFCQGWNHSQPDVPFKQIRKTYHDNIYIYMYIYIYSIYIIIYTYDIHISILSFELRSNQLGSKHHSSCILPGKYICSIHCPTLQGAINRSVVRTWDKKDVSDVCPNLGLYCIYKRVICISDIY